MAIAKFMWLLIYIAVCFAVRDDEHLPLHEQMLNALGLEFESDPEPRLRVLFFFVEVDPTSTNTTSMEY